MESTFSVTGFPTCPTSCTQGTGHAVMSNKFCTRAISSSSETQALFDFVIGCSQLADLSSTLCQWDVDPHSNLSYNTFVSVLEVVLAHKLQVTPEDITCRSYLQDNSAIQVIIDHITLPPLEPSRRLTGLPDLAQLVLVRSDEDVNSLISEVSFPTFTPVIGINGLALLSFACRVDTYLISQSDMDPLLTSVLADLQVVPLGSIVYKSKQTNGVVSYADSDYTLYSMGTDGKWTPTRPFNYIKYNVKYLAPDSLDVDGNIEPEWQGYNNFIKFIKFELSGWFITATCDIQSSASQPQYLFTMTAGTGCLFATNQVRSQAIRLRIESGINTDDLLVSDGTNTDPSVRWHMSTGAGNFLSRFGWHMILEGFLLPNGNLDADWDGNADFTWIGSSTTTTTTTSGPSTSTTAGPVASGTPYYVSTGERVAADAIDVTGDNVADWQSVDAGSIAGAKISLSNYYVTSACDIASSSSSSATYVLYMTSGSSCIFTTDQVSSQPILLRVEPYSNGSYDFEVSDASSSDPNIRWYMHSVSLEFFSNYGRNVILDGTLLPSGGLDVDGDNVADFIWVGAATTSTSLPTTASTASASSTDTTASVATTDTSTSTAPWTSTLASTDSGSTVAAGITVTETTTFTTTTSAGNSTDNTPTYIIIGSVIGALVLAVSGAFAISKFSHYHRVPTSDGAPPSPRTPQELQNNPRILCWVITLSEFRIPLMICRSGLRGYPLSSRMTRI